MGKQHTKITSEKRDLIAVWNQQGVSLRQIAKRLERSVSSISDEIQRNNYQGHRTCNKNDF